MGKLRKNYSRFFSQLIFMFCRLFFSDFWLVISFPFFYYFEICQKSSGIFIDFNFLTLILANLIFCFLKYFYEFFLCQLFPNFLSFILNLKHYFLCWFFSNFHTSILERKCTKSVCKGYAQKSSSFKFRGDFLLTSIDLDQ